MSLRIPASDPLANSSTRFAIVMRSGGSPRIIELGDRTVITIGVLSLLLLAWYLFATLYLVLRDDVVVSLVSGQRRVHYAYEDRILELRARIDRITAKQVQSQETIEDRVASLVARQAELEARAVMMADLAARAEKAGLARPDNPAPAAALPEFLTASPPALGGAALSFAPVTERRAKPMPVEPAPVPPMRPADTLPKTPMHGVVQEVERRAERVEATQMGVLVAIEETAGAQVSQSRRMVSALGLDPGRFGKSSLSAPAIRRPAPLDSLHLRDVSADQGGTDMGGPWLPAGTAEAPASFDFLFGRVETALDQARHARQVIKALPVGRPLGERFDITSSFGTRLDPFTRSPALHSGIDFRAPTGTPVRAVAGGKVIEAGPNGGYGRMVEIDHGFGISTRYAHLSVIAVNEGDTIEKGAVLGQVGSTGRSTGPHLHYEVRVDDDATDPMRYVRAQALMARQAP
ncbi:MAG: peptidoglycan DD-metalloendopeptidase family protein [Beijerinckiaceae bacterium]|nr:peptidoglycan DD-metalloendopeptidase family protein [Beijerinckiaceae bacterium]